MAQFKTQVTATRNPTDGEKSQGYWEILQYNHDDADIAIRFSANDANPILIKEVVHVVETAFGASATIDVGDGTDGDYWIDQDDITENTEGNVTSSLLSTAARDGLYYTDNGAVVVTVGGTHTAGVGRLLVYVVPL